MVSATCIENKTKQIVFCNNSTCPAQLNTAQVPQARVIQPLLAKRLLQQRALLHGKAPAFCAQRQTAAEQTTHRFLPNVND